MADIWLTHHDWCTQQSWPAYGLSFYGAGRQIREPRLVVLHSTETTSWPGYGGGAANPHLTIDLRTGHVRQHVPLNWGARALVPGPARTNNIDGTVQVEIIGAVTPGYPQRYGHYDLVNTFPTDDRAHRYLARLLRAISQACPTIPIHVSDWGKWVPYPASYGVNAPQRLTQSQWNQARGWLGHQHAPGNDHGDPGALVGLAGPVLAYALRNDGQDPTPGDNTPVYAKGHILWVQQSLNALAITDSDGNPLEEDDILGDRTEQAVRTYQQLTELGVDGIPGPNTTASLEEDMALLDQIAKDVAHVKAQQDKQGRKLDTIVAQTKPGEVATSVWSQRLYGLAAHVWVRGGRIADENHPNFPADPGMPGDLEYRDRAARGERVVPYVDGGISEQGQAKVDARYNTEETV